MTIILVQMAATWFMAGSIWTMQVLNYPLLARIGPESFTGYETAHNRRFALVVIPGVAVTAVTTVLLLVTRPAPLDWTGPVLAAVLLVAIIVMTALFQAPAHARLARGFDPPTHRSLVRTNAIRALAWTLFGLLDALMLTAVASQ